MTRNEYNYLVEEIHYGHDFEIIYNGKDLFIEKIDLKYEVYDFTNFVSNENPAPVIFTVEGINMDSLADNLLKAKLFDGKSLSECYQNIELTDIE